MTLRPPARYSPSAGAAGATGESGPNPIEHEIAGEKAAALGRAGERVEVSLARLNECSADAAERPALLKAAADAVYAYFIQRELCGLRRQQDAIRDYAIPREVLVRLGAV
ncbi:DUF6665 family protein [Mesorhizobium sp. CAU 1741]|uniref:DUF6665 family protein n=1 Tax=Mesorhizobium sp. CAU 1741 TaxID=3140366 RepID=UPI00325C2F8A